MVPRAAAVRIAVGDRQATAEGGARPWPRRARRHPHAEGPLLRLSKQFRDDQRRARHRTRYRVTTLYSADPFGSRPWCSHAHRRRSSGV